MADGVVGIDQFVVVDGDNFFADAGVAVAQADAVGFDAGVHDADVGAVAAQGFGFVVGGCGLPCA